MPAGPHHHQHRASLASAAPFARVRAAAVIGALACLAVALAGCGSATYARMPSERDLKPIAGLITENERLGNATTYHTTSMPDEPDIRVAIHAVGTGDKPTKIVFIHGVFTDSEAWRYVVPSLAEDYDLWLVDTPGCGESDAPSPGRLGPWGYGPQSLADRISQALADRLRSEPEQTRLALVAHSLGGAIAIRILGDPGLRVRAPAVHDRLESAVLMAPLDVAQNKVDTEIIRLATVGGLTIRAGDAIGYVMEQCAVNTIRGFGDPRFAVREEAEKRYEILTDAPRRKAMQAQLLQAVPFDENYRPDWDEMERQTSIYPDVDVPVLIVWGARDEVLPVSTGYLLRAMLPESELVVVPGAKHSVQLERPFWTAEAIRASVQGRAVPPPSRTLTLQAEPAGGGE